MTYQERKNSDQYNKSIKILAYHAPGAEPTIPCPQYTIKELIVELLSVEDQNRKVSIVVGDEDDTDIDTPCFEIHKKQSRDEPLELFVEAKPGIVYL